MIDQEDGEGGERRDYSPGQPKFFFFPFQHQHNAIQRAVSKGWPRLRRRSRGSAASTNVTGSPEASTHSEGIRVSNSSELNVRGDDRTEIQRHVNGL